MQKVIDDKWEAEVQTIYDSYSIYHQAAGAEQAVFQANSGQSLTRSRHLLERLQSEIGLPTTGRLLDLGCGNGALLRAFSALEPRWSLVGTELNNKYRRDVEAIDRVEAFHTCAPADVPGAFDLITMVHVLEHVANPKPFLAQLKDKLQPGGLLLIEVPDHERNPFDLLIADHSTHFTDGTLSALIAHTGLEVLHVGADWVPKELSLVARRAPLSDREFAASPLSLQVASERVNWLHETLEVARTSTATRFGVFGTSIAAAWLASELGRKVDFFVDEDTRRVGRDYFGHPVYRPSDVPPDSVVFLALPPSIASAVKTRLDGTLPGCTLVTPPSLPGEVSASALGTR